MAYNNITYATTELAQSYVNRNWVLGKNTSFVKKHVLARGAHSILAPCSFITNSVDTIIGLGVGIGVLFTAGTHKPTFKFAMNHLDGSRKIFAQPFFNLLKTINPEAKFTGNDQILNWHTSPLIGAYGNGFTAHFVIEDLKIVARSCYNSKNFLKRHVASRLTYALLAISCLVTRAVDGVICIPAASLSLLMVGKCESLNNLAYRTLKAPGIIHDLFFCTIRFINPWEGTQKVHVT